MTSTASHARLPSAQPLQSPEEPVTLSDHAHPRTLLSSQLLPHLSTLQSLESSISQDLHALLSDRTPIQQAHTRLRDLLPEIELVESHVSGVNGNGSSAEEGLVTRIGRVNEIAERVGGKVRDLDLELQRVREASERLGEVMELKANLESLRRAIDSKDWELAARSCRRAMDVPKEIIEGGFAARVVPTSDDPAPPSQALYALRQQLLDIFNENFRTAATAKDESATSRFFRLWPEIKAELEGLLAYGDFVVTLVRSRNMSTGKTSSPLYFITHLTALFESIGLIVDQHQPVVEKYYGAGRMNAVIGRLMEEGDRVLEGLFSSWEEERRVHRLLSSIKATSSIRSPPPPTSSLPSLSSTLSSTHLPSLPTAASSLLNTYNASRRAGPQPSSTNAPTPAAAPEEDNGPDLKEVDKLLGELTGMAGRWSLYRRFLWARLQDDTEDPSPPGSPTSIPNDDPLAANPDLAVVESSKSAKIIQDALQSIYEPMEIWYLRTSIDKALRLDTPDTSSPPFLSTAPDDAFYLLKIVLHRLISSGSLPTLSRTIITIRSTMDIEYGQGLKRKMDGVYAGVKAIGGSSSSSNNTEGSKSGEASSGGGGRKHDEESQEREMRASFVVYANDLDISAEHMDRLMEELLQSDAIGQAFLGEEVERAREVVRSLASLSEKFRLILKTGTDALSTALITPRIRPLVESLYAAPASYALDEESYATAEYQDLVRKRFVRGWEALMDGYKQSMTDGIFEGIVGGAVGVVVRGWEKALMGMRFTELGALRLDRDVRSIANYLSSQTSFGGSREKFVRLQQISTILNLGSDEDPREFYSTSGVPWRLSRAEYDAVCQLRS